MRKYRVAVIGAGPVGSRYATAVVERTDMELVGVVDLDAQRADSVARETGCTAYYETGRLLESSPTPHIAVVATPNNTHAALSRQVIEHGIALVCEKPLALTVQDARTVAELAITSGVPTNMPFGHTFSPVLQCGRALAASGAIGRVISAWMVRSRGYGYYAAGARHEAVLRPDVSGGWVVHHASHDAAWFNSLLGEPLEAYAAGVATGPEGLSIEEFFSIVTYSGGAMASIGDGLAPMGYGVGGINGTHGTILFETDHILLQTEPEETDHKPGRVDPEPRPAHWLHRDSSSRFHVTLNEIVDNIEGKPEKWGGVVEGYHAQRLVEAQCRSIESGTVERVLPNELANPGS